MHIIYSIITHVYTLISEHCKVFFALRFWSAFSPACGMGFLPGRIIGEFRWLRPWSPSDIWSTAWGHWMPWWCWSSIASWSLPSLGLPCPSPLGQIWFCSGSQLLGTEVLLHAGLHTVPANAKGKVEEDPQEQAWGCRDVLSPQKLWQSRHAPSHSVVTCWDWEADECTLLIGNPTYIIH